MNESTERRGAGNGMSVTEAIGSLRDHSSRIMTAGVILALLAEPLQCSLRLRQL
jgi:hypothetical protein